MSAYLVNPEHIEYLVRAAQHYGIHWRDAEGTVHDARLEPVPLANILRQENINSVSFRYPDGDLPGDPALLDAIGNISLIVPKIEPLWVIKQCMCYRYQSCEHPGWQDSPARRIIEQLLSAAICTLPGYDEIPWGDVPPYCRKPGAKQHAEA